jgi:exo-1,4-beta-D-glucosaminidase
VRHGVYPDPYVGTNNLRIPDANEDHNRRYHLSWYSHLPNQANPWAKPYWFRREFRLPKEFRGRVVWLHLHGINYRADVWLNGRQVADAKSVAGMFRRFRFDVSSVVSGTEANAVAVRVHPLDFPGDPFHEQLGGFDGSYRPCGGDGEILRNVTQYSSIGWDWVAPARDRNLGLWQHVWLEATGSVAVRDPAAMTAVRLPEADQAAVTVRCHLENSGPAEQAVELFVRILPEGFPTALVESRTKVTVSPKALTEVILKPPAQPELLIRNPRLWWPRTYGDQPLYQLTVEARVDGRLSSRVASRFGVRTVGTRILPSGGRAFTVNGRTIRMTGGAWVPDFLASWGAQRYRDELRLMAEGNHTIVRVNGCGIVPPDVFFEACDRHGLLVWQDLSRTSVQAYWRDRRSTASPGPSVYLRKDGVKTWNPPRCDPALYLANMRDCILRLRGHPSLLLWCGSNEAAPQADVGEPLQNEILPALDGMRPWLPDSHESPSWRREDLHTWTGGPWWNVRLPEYFKFYEQNAEYTCRNEIGLFSPPSINSVVKAVPDHDQPLAEQFPWNRDLGYHDAMDFVKKADAIIREDLGEPACLAEYLWMGDVYSSLSYLNPA